MMRINRCLIMTLAVVGLLLQASVISAQPGPAGGIYSKPYLSGDEAAVKVGGYIDMEFKYDVSGNSTFDQHRLIPFFFAEVTPDLHFSSEIEYEHGGNVDNGGEVKVEYAVVDYRFTDAFQLRTGIVLTPLGRFNLVHDSPVNDLTDRPLVDRNIIPTTLSEAGVGLFGVAYPSEMSVLNYEVYLVNGFDDGMIRSDSTVRIRSGRGSQKSDNNRNKSLAARVNYSPRLGVDVGLSAYTGTYDDADEDRLTIVALDTDVRWGPLEAQAEYAQATIERSHLGLPRQTQRGYFLQGNVHFLQDRLKPGSTFTGVVRWDAVDYGRRGTPDNEEARLTFGVNYRPVEKAVFKTDFQFNWSKVPGGELVPQDERILASVAVYF